MGLDTTHDCWHGPYSSFMRWREKLAAAAGLPPLREFEGYTDIPKWKWSMLYADPLVALLNHSDCEGEIGVEYLLPLAARLEELAPALADDPIFPSDRKHALKFAAGLREAARKGEAVEFH